MGGAQIPIVYVTAYAHEQTMAQARTPQPVLAVRKPFDVSQLPHSRASAQLLDEHVPPQGGGNKRLAHGAGEGAGVGA